MTTAAVRPARVVAGGETSARRLLTVKELAVVLGVSADYVYRHQDALGALRLPGGDGERGRLRFHLPTTLAALATSRSSGERSQPSRSPATSNDPSSAQPPATGTRVPLLPVQGVGRA
jgi:hypothetical protein